MHDITRRVHSFKVFAFNYLTANHTLTITAAAATPLPIMSAHPSYKRHPGEEQKKKQKKKRTTENAPISYYSAGSHEKENV
jgi:hypothetical protein